MDILWSPSALTTNTSKLYFRGGLQYHDIPILDTSDISNQSISVNIDHVINYSLGVGYEKRFAENWSVELFGRLQTMMQNSGSDMVELDYSFGFDGSV